MSKTWVKMVPSFFASEAGTGFGIPVNNFTYDDTNIRPLANNNFISEALVALMPGLCSDISLTLNEGFDNLGDLSEALGVGSDIGNDDLENDGDAAEVNPDDGCVFFAEKGNISSMISEREAKNCKYSNAPEDDVMDVEE